jgi:glutamate/tyrosine decarboxylase-like PLP-dependent enzyme
MIGDDMSLARRLHGHVQQHPDFEAMTQNLSITTFRSVPRDLRDRVGSPETERYLDSLNQDLLTRVERSGEAFLSNAVVDGRFALRACVVNFRTTAADIDALLPLLARIGSEVGLRR